MKYDIIIEKLNNWLIQYIEISKSKGFVIGVSGGIDSALTSTLCAKTGLPTLCIDMPILQSNNEISRAKEHIAWLKSKYNNVSDLSIDLNNTFKSFRSAVENKNNENNFLSLANSRSRLRMTTLYYYSGIHNYLVAGTGNKVEDFGIGFYTKYGDGGVDISPIADLTKTDVFNMASKLGIITKILEAKPTDGLWEDGRTDQDQLGGLSYEQMERAMQLDDLNALAVGPEVESLEKYRELRAKNLHKMQPIPVFKKKR